MLTGETLASLDRFKTALWLETDREMLQREQKGFMYHQFTKDSFANYSFMCHQLHQLKSVVVHSLHVLIKHDIVPCSALRGRREEGGGSPDHG